MSSVASSWRASTRSRGCGADGAATSAPRWRSADDRGARRTGPDPGRRLGSARRSHNAADQAGGDEGLYNTTRGAPEQILGWYTGQQVKYGIQIPHLLSILSFHSWNATVQGLAAVPPGQRPPVNVVRIAFQTMVGIGTLLALLGVLHLVVWIRRRRLPESVWFHRALVAAGPLAVVALIAGWVVTEVGRQP
jgi:cytochrome d ubiquinol oxidase subunit I